MYQLLFLSHGMGNGAQPTGAPAWFTDIVTGLRVAAKPFAHDKDLVLSSPKAGQVLVVPLTYHPLFDKIRAKWSEQSPSESGWLPLLKGLAFSDPQVLAKLPGWVATAGAFFWTHVLDVLLYRYVSELTVPIREEVATQIADAWHRADLDNGANTAVHFVAHSLGTSVLHDSIATLGADPAFSPGTHLIQSVVTCANVSSVLETNFPAYASVDRPGDAMRRFRRTGMRRARPVRRRSATCERICAPFSRSPCPRRRPASSTSCHAPSRHFRTLVRHARRKRHEDTS